MKLFISSKLLLILAVLLFSCNQSKRTQFFDIMASRGIYNYGWFASARGPRELWVGGIPKGIKQWSPLTDTWQLYNLDQDWSQAVDLAAKEPKKLEELKALFLTESAKNKNLPIGGGLWSTALYHPEDAPASRLTEWTFDSPIKGMLLFIYNFKQYIISAA